MENSDKTGSYGQFCPVSMAAEILCTRWTPLVVRELLCGSMHFNDLRRGVPRMSPTLLSKRLKELEQAGIVVREGDGGSSKYRLTKAGEDLRGFVMTIGVWGQRWIETGRMLDKLDVSLLMWDMRRHLDPKPMPERRSTILFRYPELPEGRRDWWLVVEKGEVDLCRVDPGHEVDLEVEADLRTMTAIWMGYTTLRREVEAGAVTIEGDRSLAASIGQWLALNPLAREGGHGEAAA
jgi:DNA-binding HxlR family transcriptional regulator